LIQHAFDKYQKTGYKQAGVLHFECDPKYGKYKKTAYVLYSDYPICHPSLVISLIMFQLTGKEMKYEVD